MVGILQESFRLKLNIKVKQQFILTIDTVYTWILEIDSGKFFVNLG